MHSITDTRTDGETPEAETTDSTVPSTGIETMNVKAGTHICKAYDMSTTDKIWAKNQGREVSVSMSGEPLCQVHFPGGKPET